MSWDLYWRGPLSAFSIYVEAQIKKTHNEKLLSDYSAWRVGLYTKAAITSTYHLLNPLVKTDTPKYPYPAMAYELQEIEDRKKTKKEEQEALLKEQQAQYERLSVWAAAFKKERS